MKVILGIDPGLAAIGYGLIAFGNNRFQYLDHGVIHTAADKPMGERLVKIYHGISELIDKFQPHEAAIENLYFARNRKSAISVAQARGVILLALARAGVPFGEYTPLQLKQAVVGRGRGRPDKVQIQEMIRVILGLSTIPKPDHGADALAAAICHAGRSDMAQIVALAER
jgi:crossover junction endodeoxyribonuclease RuvC